MCKRTAVSLLSPAALEGYSLDSSSVSKGSVHNALPVQAVLQVERPLGVLLLLQLRDNILQRHPQPQCLRGAGVAQPCGGC